ncbi:MAG: hypothetical protein E3K32_05425 [wastewater metagenome]|nr:hypothetical protein [Candidatus Loosdrechtia aerotolerans]
MLFYILISCTAAFLAFLALRKLFPLLINCFDKANTNNRYVLPADYERPKYYVINKSGTADTARKWPGWDGWYFLTLLDSQDPAQLIRGSIMTGMYGIEGIDNYENLMLSISTDNVIECLFMLPQPEVTLLSHEYIIKHLNLHMQTDSLKVKVTGRGEIAGKWPVYTFLLSNPQDELTLSLQYRAQNVIWWADLPGFFTYFTTFGHMDGELKQNGQVLKKISSVGCFEHGYARKWFDYDPLFLPVRLWKRLFPVNVAEYHYDLLFTDEGMHGGMMRTKGFGIELRNRGGIYLPGGEYVKIKNIKSIVYEGPKLIENNCTAKPVTFYEQWRVKAKTEKGILSYTAKQVYPSVHVAKHMIFYSFVFEGMLGDQKLKGKGYGEYARI